MSQDTCKFELCAFTGFSLEKRLSPFFRYRETHAFIFERILILFDLTFAPGGMPPADPKRAGYRKTIPGPYPYKAFQPVNLQDVTIAYTAELAALIGDARSGWEKRGPR